MPKDFILGKDLSSIISEENIGIKFFNFEGIEKDVFEVLRYFTINYIWIRIWNNPFDWDDHVYGWGNYNMENMEWKFYLHIIFQILCRSRYLNVPKAWRGLTLDEKIEKWQNIQENHLQVFINEVVDVRMVALGNEINDFFCGETEYPNIVKIQNTCSKVVRELLPNILISVHFTNPEREGSLMYFAKSLNDNNLDYDVFSVLYYKVWSGDLSCLDQLNDVAATYNKRILIAETQYPYTRDNLDYYPNKTPGYDDYLYYPLTVQGQATHIWNLFNYVVGLKNRIGVFYWEGAWIAVGTTDYYENLEKLETYGSGGASSYSLSYDSRYFGGGAPTQNQALFNSEEKPLEYLKVFNVMKYGNEDNTLEDGIEDISVNPGYFTIFSLLNQINVIDTSDQRITKNVIWNGDLDLDKAQNQEQYDYTCQADNIDVKCVFENNTSSGRRFFYSYYIGDEFLSLLILKNMIQIRET